MNKLIRQPIAAFTSACLAMPVFAQDASPETSANEGAGSFVAYREVEGQWYHPPEFAGDTDADVYRSVYARIAATDAERSDNGDIDSIIAYGPGNWTCEWDQEGALAAGRAADFLAAGDTAAAIDEFERATKFYARGSWPHLKSDEAAKAALHQARLAYAAGADLLPGDFEEVEIPFDGRTFGGDLFMPEGDGPFPVVVALNGTDVVKEQRGFGLPRAFLAHDIAVLVVDMAGVGGSGDYTLTGESDALPLAAVDYIRSHAGVDSDRAALMGVSVGGHGAARALFNADANLSAVISHCAPLDFAFANAAALVPQLPQLTTDGFADSMGLPLDTSPEDIGVALEAFAFSAQGLVNETPVDTPLLVITTNADPIAPLDDLPLITGATSNSTVVVLDEPGHCPAYWEINALSANWLATVLGTF